MFSTLASVKGSLGTKLCHVHGTSFTYPKTDMSRHWERDRLNGVPQESSSNCQFWQSRLSSASAVSRHVGPGTLLCWLYTMTSASHVGMRRARIWAGNAAARDPLCRLSLDWGSASLGPRSFVSVISDIHPSSAYAYAFPIPFASCSPSSQSRASSSFIPLPN